MLEQLGALDWVDVQVLLPAASGHINYSPNPSQIRDLAQARVFVRSGLPFENRIWERLRRLNPDMAVVEAPSGETSPVHDHEHEHDPHFWLDPMLMLAQAETVAAVLPSNTGADESVIRANLKTLRRVLHAVDEHIKDRLADSDRTSFWTFHGSWGHFAEHYGLEQHALEFEGKESGLRTMIELVSELKASGAQFIIVEPGLDRRRLSALQNEAGLEFVELNPMRHDYDQALLDAAAAIAGDRP